MAQVYNYFSLRPKYDYKIFVVFPKDISHSLKVGDALLEKYELPPKYSMESTYFTIQSFLMGIDIEAKYEIPVVVILMYDDDPDHSVLIKDDELDHIVNKLRSFSDDRQHAWDIIQKEHLHYSNHKKKDQP